VIDHENGFWSLYGHLKRATVKEGDRVKKGDKIGVQGNTGKSAGEHLHFEIIVDPLMFFEAPIGLNDRERKELLHQ
jgi:murein DD-endopeptidase MepM/ murein hydrolase activator NlpD